MQNIILYELSAEESALTLSIYKLFSHTDIKSTCTVIVTYLCNVEN